MTDTSQSAPKLPLGVGAIIADTFSIFFRNIIPVFILGFLPALAGIIISVALIGWGATIGTGAVDFSTTLGTVQYLVALFLQLAIYGIAVAMLVQLAYDSKLGRPIKVQSYFAPALRGVVPIVILGIVYYLMIVFASIALVIPGLWVWAVFSVLVPAIVIENAGFRALGRSATLTKEYRWPVLGALLLILVCSFLIGLVFGLGGVLLENLVGPMVTGVIFAGLTGLSYGLIGISISLIYARLREIKEGIGVDDLVAVFE